MAQFLQNELKPCVVLLVLLLSGSGFSKPQQDQGVGDLEEIEEREKSKTSYNAVELEVTFNGNLSVADVHAHSKVVVCYVGTWATYRPEDGKYDLLERFKPDLCTHLIYSFAGLDNVTHTLKPLDAYLDLEDNYGKGWYKKAASIKQKYRHLKVLLAIGGWNEGSEKYSKMAEDSEKRGRFINSAFDMIMKYGFDGLDLDWEFPARRGGRPADKQHFTILVKELREKLDKHDLLLTAAFGASEDIASVSYNLRELSGLLDHIHIMCYDYHGSWDGFTAHNAPLFAPKGNLSVEASVNYFLSQGVHPNKLVLGLPLYGRTFLLNDESIAGGALEKPAKAVGFQGPYTREDGFLGYNEICKELASNRGYWTTYWDGYAKVPFMRNGAKWISFDNVESLYQKVEFAMKKGLRGAMVWSMDTDDFLSTCGGSKYPLLRAINYALAFEENTINSKKAGKHPKKPVYSKPSSASRVSFQTLIFVFSVTTLSLISWTHRY